MTTLKKAAKKAPGRPKKAAEDRLEQFSIRLPPKLKYGLELLARAQSRSLSQAAEWAIQVGLNGYKVNSDWSSVADLLERAWSEENEFRRNWMIYLAAPQLLGFEERSACEIVEGSTEYRFALEHPADSGVEFDELRSRGNARNEILLAFVGAYWKTVREAAVARFSAGKTESTSLLAMLNFSKHMGGADEFAVMKAMTEIAGKELLQEGFADRVVELGKEFPWSRKNSKSKKAANPSSLK